MKATVYPGGIALVEEIWVGSASDALDIMMNVSYLHRCRSLIWLQQHIHPDFFELRTGLAGEILQKFSNYRMRLAIVGDFSQFTSRALRDFIYECNSASAIAFVSTVPEAIEKLS